MSAVWLFACGAALALCTGATVLLAGRRLVLQARRAPAASEVPALVRWVSWPARMLEPLVDLLLPPRLAGTIARTLESVGLYPQVTPALWWSARLVHATAAGLLAWAMPGAGPLLCATAATAGFLHGALWLRHRRSLQVLQITRELPSYLDLLVVCVEAGATLSSGIRLVVSQAPASPLRSYFERVLREIRGGRTRAQALSQAAEASAVECLTTLASALAHAESSGMSLGSVLRAQAEQRTAERFARAERLAMQAPVKMLGPLILCIFPCTFIVIAVPIAVRLKEALFT